MIKNIKAVIYETLSTEYQKRWVIVDVDTGEILDNAQGYGYKSAQKAYAAYAYLNRDKSKDLERLETENHIRQWMREHKNFVRTLERYAFEICKGSWSPEDKVDEKSIEFILEQHGLEIDFTPAELLRFWRKKW